jgi:hypothetical protein
MVDYILDGQMVLNEENLKMLIEDGTLHALQRIPKKTIQVNCSGCKNHTDNHAKSIIITDYEAVYNFLLENRATAQKIKEKFGKKKILIYFDRTEHSL